VEKQLDVKLKNGKKAGRSYCEKSATNKKAGIFWEEKRLRVSKKEHSKQPEKETFQVKFHRFGS